MPGPAAPAHRLRPPDRLNRQRQRQARKRRRGWVALLLVLLLTAIAALAGWYLTEGRFTTAPALTALSRAEAEQVAGQVGPGHPLRRGVQRDASRRGVVIGTDPGAGTKIIKGGRIEAAVSRGPERFSMPTVVGLTQDGRRIGRAEGQSDGWARSGREYSETVADGRWCSARPSSRAPG